MRKVLLVVALGAILAVPLVGSAGATGGLPQVPVPDVKAPEAPDVDEVCKRVFVPANVRLAAGVEKRITVAGKVFEANVNEELVKLFKTIELLVCVQTENVEADVNLDEAVVGVAECPDGAEGAVIRVTVPLRAGAEGGAVNARVRLAVHDTDVVLGQTIEDETRVLIDEDKRIDVPAGEVVDNDFVDADVCVGPVEAE